ELLADFGGFGLLFTGMCSARTVPGENPDISTVFTWREEELPWLVCQIFGAEPRIMAEAAKRVQEEGFFGIDLNFGCCAGAICRKGSGAALLKTPELAADIVFQVRKTVNIPLFVKFRTGWDNSPEKSAEAASLFESAGADALVFHPRAAPDRRTRPPVWGHIKYVKEAVSIPVFGNGNIFNAEDCCKITMETGCDGVSLGRMAVAKPWIFASLGKESGRMVQEGPGQTIQKWPGQMAHKEPGQTVQKGPGQTVHKGPGEIFSDMEQGDSPNIYHYCASRFMALLLKYNSDKTAVRMFRKFVPYFAANFKFGHQICMRLLKGENPHEITKIIDSVLHPVPETSSQANPSLFH
ncbi:MAG: tRNA-dihydrouridine synthase family protein, partial [Desulfamplus sp.]|nr:tRNA-dihydrouridine synthase family protein [Desulfamplus sp.]